MPRYDHISLSCTSIKETEYEITVQYRGVDVVRWLKNINTVWLCTGGYYTKSTALRMNQASGVYGLGFHVTMHVGGPAEVTTKRGNTWAFFDETAFSTEE